MLATEIEREETQYVNLTERQRVLMIERLREDASYAAGVLERIGIEDDLGVRGELTRITDLIRALRSGAPVPASERLRESAAYARQRHGELEEAERTLLKRMRAGKPRWAEGSRLESRAESEQQSRESMEMHHDRAKLAEGVLQALRGREKVAA